MFCTNCGNKLNSKANFCPKCGFRVDIRTIDESSIEQKEETKRKKKQHNKKNKKWWFVFLMVTIFALVLYYLYSKEIIPAINNSDDNEIIVTDRNTIYELDEKDIKYDEEQKVHYVDNIIIVFLAEDASENSINELLKEINGTIAASIPLINQYQIRIPERSYNELEQLCRFIESMEYVEKAYIDLAFQNIEQNVPNDPWNKGIIDSLLSPNDWDTDNPNGRNWWLEAINAPEAWEYVRYFSTIAIGIVDNGFDTEHEDLRNIKGISYNNNKESHGTHVAGIIGAEANNNIGISGIVWNSELFTADWELSDEQENDKMYSNWYTTNQIHSLVANLITQNNVKVVNLSAGCSASIEKDKLSFFDDDEKNTQWINSTGEMSSRYLSKLLEKGYDFLIIQSAGNGNEEGTYSVDSVYNGDYASINIDNCVESDSVSKEEILNRIIIVGAAEQVNDTEFVQAKWSNAGDGVDICAPGVHIYSTIPGGYGYKSGTSMAAPVVTGVAALVWSANEALTGPEVKGIICNPSNTKYEVADNTSEFHPLNNTYRMVNAELAVKESLKRRPDGEEVLASDNTDYYAEKINYKGVVGNPEDVVLKAFDAMNAQDFEKFVNCLDPSTEKLVNTVGTITSAITGAITGNYCSWEEYVSEELSKESISDIEVIECYAYDYEFVSTNSSQNGINRLISNFDLPFLCNIVCNEADVYVKYRYVDDGEYRIGQDNYHVKRYGMSGWRIKMLY